MLNKQAIKHPIVFGIVVILLFEIVMQTIGAFIILFGPRFLVNNGDYILQGTVESFVALAGIGLVALFGYNSIWGEKGKGFFKGLGVGGYFIYIQITALFAGISSIAMIQEESGSLIFAPGWKIAGYIICYLLVGFAEEVFFRGLIANFLFDKHAKDPAGVWTATIWSGLLFGLMHITNIVGSTEPAYAASIIVQVISTVVMGMAFTAVYYRSRNIWVVIFLHAMNNICADISSGLLEGSSLSDTLGSYPPIMAITSSIPFLAVTLILLRPKKLKEVVRPDFDESITMEQRIARYTKSKRSRVFAIVVSLLICVALFFTSVSLVWDGTVNSIFGDLLIVSESNYSFDYSVYETWSGEDSFGEAKTFVASRSGEHTMIVRSYPGSTSAYLKLTISDSEGKVVFSESYGGRCSDTVELTLEQGVTYTVNMEYDFSLVTDGTTVDYTTMITIE